MKISIFLIFDDTKQGFIGEDQWDREEISKIIASETL